MQLNMYHIQRNTLIQSEKWYHKNHEFLLIMHRDWRGSEVKAISLMNKVCKRLKNDSASTTSITKYHSRMTGVKVYKYLKLRRFFS